MLKKIFENVFNSTDHQKIYYSLVDFIAVDSVVAIKKGINNYFQVPVVNQSKHDIVLHKNTNVGVSEYQISNTTTSQTVNFM